MDPAIGRQAGASVRSTQNAGACVQLEVLGASPCGGKSEIIAAARPDGKFRALLTTSPRAFRGLSMYESEITRFLKDLRQQKPQLEQSQRDGRAIWWDKPQDLDTARRNRESRIAQRPYVYSQKP